MSGHATCTSSTVSGSRLLDRPGVAGEGRGMPDFERALVVLPELHVSDKGLVGVSESGFGFVEPFEHT